MEEEPLWKWHVQEIKRLHLILETVSSRDTYRTWEQAQIRTRNYPILNWLHAAHHSSKETTRYIFTIITFSFAKKISYLLLLLLKFILIGGYLLQNIVVAFAIFLHELPSMYMSPTILKQINFVYCKLCRRKEIITVLAEINQKEMKETMAKITKT